MTEDYSGPAYPGQQFGLPESGDGSVGSWGRRVVALAVDWLLSMLAVGAFIGTEVWTGRGAAQWAPLAVFALQRVVLTSTLAGSAGQLVTGLRVRFLPGSGGLLWRVFVRTALICLVIPALITNSDRRGLHDLAAGTVVVRI